MSRKIQQQTLQAPVRVRGDSAIVARRQLQETADRHIAALQQMTKVQHDLACHQKVDRSIARGQIKRIAGALKAQSDAALSERRRALSALLQQEDSEFQSEMAAIQDFEGSSAGRQRRLVARASENRETKETRRQQEAQEKYREHWIQNNHELRAIEADFFNKHVHETVAAQKDVMKEARRQQAEMDSEWAKSWEEDRLRREEADRLLMEKRAQFNNETTRGLDQQMEMNRNKLLARERLEAEDQANFAKKMAEEDDLAHQRAKEQFQQKQLEQRKVNMMNEQTRLAKMEVALREKQADRESAAYANREYTAGLEAQALAQKQYAQDLLHHIDHCRKTREQERLQDLEVQRAVDSEAARIQSKFDAQQERAQQARDRLARDAYNGRAEQIKNHEREARIQEESKLIERSALIREAERAELIDKLEEEQRREREERRRQTLEKQIQANRNRRDVMEARVIQERETAERLEAQKAQLFAVEKDRLLATRGWSAPAGRTMLGSLPRDGSISMRNIGAPLRR